MARAKRKAPESTSATLANGTKVSGPPAVVARLVARSKAEAKPARKAPAKPAEQSDE